MSNEQLAALSPELDSMAKMVRRHSILLRATKTSEIYRIITEHSDPRIALRLAAAKNKDGVPIFASERKVKEAMFGPPNPNDPQFENPDLNIFVDGVRRVSAALAASWLVGQLAQIEEQRRHGELLEKQALEDLDFLIRQYEREVRQTAQTEIEVGSESFYFEDLTLTLTDTLIVEVFIPGVTSSFWRPVGSYSGEVQTARLVADICDTINEVTLNNQDGNLIAAPILSEDRNLHRIEISGRNRDSVIAHELISIRIRYQNAPWRELPFAWGVDPNHLRRETINSHILRIERGAVQAVGSSASRDEVREPTVLYFRRGPLNGNQEPVDAYGNVIPAGQWIANGKVVFRISPTMTEAVTVSVPRLMDPDPTVQLQLDSHRYSQVALLILNELYRQRLEGTTPVRALAALVRNDDPQQSQPMAALELVAYTLNQVETWMILDVLELPADIQMAVGDLRGPITPFSNKPRSVRVEAQFMRSAAAEELNRSAMRNPAFPTLVRRPVSSTLEKIRSQMRTFFPDEY